MGTVFQASVTLVNFSKMNLGDLYFPQGFHITGHIEIWPLTAQRLYKPGWRAAPQSGRQDGGDTRPHLLPCGDDGGGEGGDAPAEEARQERTQDQADPRTGLWTCSPCWNGSLLL